MPFPKGAHQRLPNVLSQVFASQPPTPSPPLFPSCPRILENRKCILLSDGWAPRSSLRGKRREEKKRNLSFPPGQSDEFSSLKAEGRLCSFHGAPWSPWSPSAWKPLLRHVCVWRELKAASLRWTCGSRTYEAEAKNSLAAANRLPGSSLFSRGGQEVCVGVRPADLSGASDSGSVPGTSLCTVQYALPRLARPDVTKTKL